MPCFLPFWRHKILSSLSVRVVRFYHLCRWGSEDFIICPGFTCMNWLPGLGRCNTKKNGRMGILQGIAHGSNRMLWLKMAQGSEHLVKSRWQAWHLCDRFISLTLGFWNLVGFWMGQNGWLGWNGWKGWAGACLSKIMNWFLVVKFFNKEVF